MNIENDLDFVHFDPENPHNASNHSLAWKNGRWNYQSGYYAMQKDVPKGVEYAQKAKLNLLKMEMEEYERLCLEEEEALLNEEKKKKEAVDPQMAEINAEFVKFFIHGLKETIDKPYEVYEEELKDIYVEENMPNIFIQKIMKGVAKKVLRVAEEETSMKGKKGLDFR